MRALRFLRLPALAAVIALAIGYLVYFPGTALTQGTSLWPQATSCAVAITDTTCIAANPTRRAITICNVGATYVAWISPGVAAVANGGTSYPLAPVTSNAAACYTTPLLASGAMGSSWHAIAVSTATTLMIWEF